MLNFYLSPYLRYTSLLILFCPGQNVIAKVPPLSPDIIYSGEINQYRVQLTSENMQIALHFPERQTQIFHKIPICVYNTDPQGLDVTLTSLLKNNKILIENSQNGHTIPMTVLIETNHQAQKKYPNLSVGAKKLHKTHFIWAEKGPIPLHLDHYAPHQPKVYDSFTQTCRDTPIYLSIFIKNQDLIQSASGAYTTKLRFHLT